MLAFYKDAALTRPVSGSLPKRFLVETSGGTRSTSLWLGDAYAALATAPAAIGATSLQLDQTAEFADSGWAFVNGITITYTGRTAHSLTGVSGLTVAVAINDQVQPGVVYRGAGNLQIGSYGTAGIQVSLRAPGSTYCFPGAAVILGVTQIRPGAAHAVQVDVQVQVASGEEQDIDTWGMSVSAIYRTNVTDVSPIDPGSYPKAVWQVILTFAKRGLQLQVRPLACFVTRRAGQGVTRCQSAVC